MGEISEIVKDLNWPKQILDKSESLIKTLFGPSFDELGGMISDQIKLRRFKNQLKIFTKAQEILKEKNIDPKKVSLKVLAPLIELSSYEEEESLQQKWAQLTAHIIVNNSDTIFQQNCINILNKISNEESMLLDKLYSLLKEKKILRKERDLLSAKKYPKQAESILNRTLLAHDFKFGLNEVGKKLELPNESLEFQLSNLIALGLINWETFVEVSAEKSDEDPEDSNIDVDVDVFNYDTFVFTSLGLKFVEVCKG
jgi:Abortive infection alpha